jgi:hypothetical protein
LLRWALAAKPQQYLLELVLLFLVSRLVSDNAYTQIAVVVQLTSWPSYCDEKPSPAT